MVPYLHLAQDSLLAWFLWGSNAHLPETTFYAVDRWDFATDRVQIMVSELLTLPTEDRVRLQCR